MKNLITVIIVSCLCSLWLSCSDTNPKVEIQNDNSTTIEIPDSTSESVYNEREVMSKETFTTMLANTNHVEMLGFAASSYLTSYGRLPEDIQTLFDYMFIWPGSVYTQQPIHVLSVHPDPANSEHVGGVYYEVINDHSAVLSFLDINPLEDGDAWIVNTVKIKPVSKNITSDGSYQEAEKVTNMPLEQRYWFGYQRNLDQSLLFLLTDALARRGFVEHDINELAANGNYYFNQNQISKIKTGVQENQLVFNIGATSDRELYYYSYHDISDNLIYKCCKLENLESVKAMIECTDKLADNISIFESGKINEYIFDENLIISTDDI